MREALRLARKDCALRFAHSSLRPRSPSGTLALTVSLTPCRYPSPYPNSTADKTQPEESSQKKVISPTSGPQLRAEAILVRPQQPSAVRTEIKASEFPADAGAILRGPKHQVISALVSLPEGYARSESSATEGSERCCLISITPAPAPWLRGAAPSGRRIVVRPRAVATVWTSVRYAVAPMRIAPLVTPVVAVPAPSAPVTYQL